MPAEGRSSTRALGVVAGATAVSGAVQTIRPELVLGLIAAEHDRLARQLFATIGMFMTGSGCLLAQNLTTTPDRTVLRWVGLEKLGSAIALTVGVRRTVFKRRALAVAAFDLASGVLCLAQARTMDRAEVR